MGMGMGMVMVMVMETGMGMVYLAWSFSNVSEKSVESSIGCERRLIFDIATLLVLLGSLI